MSDYGINYHHLHQFWMVAREGGMARAATRLHVTQPTLSAQVRSLEKRLGMALFSREGRRLELTDAGRIAYRYADEIFRLGREMRDALKGQETGQPIRLNVGALNAMPKLIVYNLLNTALSTSEQPIQVNCREGRIEELLAELSIHGLDLVLTDVPVGPEARVRAFNHLLGECGQSVFAPPVLAEQYRTGFPQSLHGAPLLMPTSHAFVRREINGWFDRAEITPQLIGEFEDSALMKVFGQSGRGLFFGPTAIETEIIQQYDVAVVGRIPQIRERFYAVSIERKLEHPAVVAISEAARRQLFAIDESPIANEPN